MEESTWRNIKGFSVSSVIIVNRLASSERLTQVCRARPFMHLKVMAVSL